MKTYAIVDSLGDVCRIEYANSLPDVINSFVALEIDGTPQYPSRMPWQRLVVVGRALVFVDTRTLAAKKLDKWAQVKAERSRREVATFSCAGLTYDCNVKAITGSALSAVIAKNAIIGQIIGPPWAQTWVLADNSVTTLNADQMIAVGQACKDYIAGLWATSQSLRDQINAAQTAEAVAAVTWP